MQAIPSVRAAVSRVARSVGATRGGWQAGGRRCRREHHRARTWCASSRWWRWCSPCCSDCCCALVAPLYLVASVVLSYTASLGLAVLIFVTSAGTRDQLHAAVLHVRLHHGPGRGLQHPGHEQDQEEAARLPLRAAVPRALATTGTTVTSAGLILAGTFGVLALATTGQVRQIGTGLALGILLDTFLVRTLLVPSTVVLLGAWNWWPLRAWTEAPSVREREGQSTSPRWSAKGTISRTPSGAPVTNRVAVCGSRATVSGSRTVGTVVARRGSRPARSKPASTFYTVSVTQSRRCTRSTAKL